MAPVALSRAPAALATAQRVASNARTSAKPAPVAAAAPLRSAFRATLSGSRVEAAIRATGIKSSRAERLVVRAADSNAPAGGSFLGVSTVTLKKARPETDASLPNDRRSILCPIGGAPGSQKSRLILTHCLQVIPLGFMFFCILFNYTILRDTKDVLVVTAPGSGAEIIPFLKTWVNLPMAIGFMFLYGQLANMMSTQALFYTVIFPFIAFFGAFAFVIYPLRDVIHPNSFCDYVLSVIGDRFSAPIAIIRNWSYCLFYVMAELWGSVVVSVLFWVRRPASPLARRLPNRAR